MSESLDPPVGAANLGSSRVKEEKSGEMLWASAGGPKDTHGPLLEVVMAPQELGTQALHRNHRLVLVLGYVRGKVGVGKEFVIQLR